MEDDALDLLLDLLDREGLTYDEYVEMCHEAGVRP
jgi:hypothetical protein